MAEENISLEERLHLIEAALAFSSYVTDRYPQINDDNKLNYSISGSLAMILLSQADTIEKLDSSQLPKVSLVEEQRLPDGLRSKLADFTRKIGDFDFVGTEVYDQALREANSYWPKNPEKYGNLRSKIITKGGGGPSVDELPDLARDILVEAKPGTKIMCDPVETYEQDQVVRIRVRGKNYFVSDPMQIFGYKVLHLMQSFSNKPSRFTRDFAILHGALSELCSEEELIESAYSVIVRFEDSMSEYGPKAVGYMAELYRNMDFNSTVRPFFERLKEYDKNHRRIIQPKS